MLNDIIYLSDKHVLKKKPLIYRANYRGKNVTLIISTS